MEGQVVLTLESRTIPNPHFHLGSQGLDLLRAFSLLASGHNTLEAGFLSSERKCGFLLQGTCRIHTIPWIDSHPFCYPLSFSLTSHIPLLFPSPSCNQFQEGTFLNFLVVTRTDLGMIIVIKFHCDCL